MLTNLLSFATGLSLVAGALLLWAIALLSVVWLCFFLCSRFARLTGRRHRHQRWHQLNG